MRATWASFVADTSAIEEAGSQGSMRRAFEIEHEYIDAVRQRSALEASGRCLDRPRVPIDDNGLVELIRSCKPSRRAALEALCWIDADAVGPVADAYIRELVGCWDVSHAVATGFGRRRELNEDAFIARPDLRLYAVLDGMGGHASGSAASAVCGDTVIDAFDDALDGILVGGRTPEETFVAALSLASERLTHVSRWEQRLTTIASLFIVDSSAIIAHVGDSRVYRLHDGQLEQHTKDHRLLGELLASGAIAADDALDFPHQNVVTRAIMPGQDATPVLTRVPIVAGDSFLLTTDGVTDAISHSELTERVVAAPPTQFADVVAKLVEDERVSDNATAMLVHCGVSTA